MRLLSIPRGENLLIRPPGTPVARSYDEDATAAEAVMSIRLCDGSM